MFAKSFISLALLASSALAAVSFQTVPSSFVAGQSYTLTYSADDLTVPVTITLRKGDPKNLDTVGPLTTTATGGSYTWTVPSDIVSGTTYALQISQGTAINYYGPFSVTGGTGVVSSAVAVSSVAPSSVVIPSASASGKISSIASLATAKPSSYSNSTTTHSSSITTKISTTKLSSSSPATATATTVPNSASSLSSPIALILGAVAAMFYLH